MKLYFRPLTEDDIPMLCEWLNRPHVSQWWRGEQSMQQVREKYLPRISGSGDARPFVACVDSEPVGYVQYYAAADGEPGWWPDEPGPDVFGIDQFIGPADRVGRGLGTRMVKEFVAFLMRDDRVGEVRADPSPENGRAIRCYEKAGFERVRDIVTPDGPAVWMVYRR